MNPHRLGAYGCEEYFCQEVPPTYGSRRCSAFYPCLNLPPPCRIRVETWHDRNIDAGDDWKQRIDDNLERADIVLLLVSADFIASDYCYEKEMKRALERHNNGEARVIPLIVRDVSWHKAPFAKLQALPKDSKAVTLWDDRDSAWRNISEGIERVVEEIIRTRSDHSAEPEG